MHSCLIRYIHIKDGNELVHQLCYHGVKVKDIGRLSLEF